MKFTKYIYSPYLFPIYSFIYPVITYQTKVWIVTVIKRSEDRIQMGGKSKYGTYHKGGNVCVRNI